MYPFRMCGRLVETYRYQMEYTEEQGNKARYFPTQEKADATAARESGTVTELDASAYAWMDGLEVSDVPDTYAEAIKIYEMGQTEYQCVLAFAELKRADQLRADLDYVMLMGGL